MKDLIGCFENIFHFPVSLFGSSLECIMYSVKATWSNVNKSMQGGHFWVADGHSWIELWMQQWVKKYEYILNTTISLEEEQIFPKIVIIVITE